MCIRDRITRDILAYKNEDGAAVIDLILDSAGQKGTGKWTATNALEMGIPLTLIGEAVFARFLSALKEERVAASQVLAGPGDRFTSDETSFVDDLREAVYAAKIVSYAQGYMPVSYTHLDVYKRQGYYSAVRSPMARS